MAAVNNLFITIEAHFNIIDQNTVILDFDGTPDQNIFLHPR